MKEKNTTAVHAIVHGHVQGVGFRHFTRTTAQRLGIKGWVRNNPDGTVEIRAEGSRSDLENLVRAVKRGPSHSSVEQVDVEWEEPKGEFSAFRVRY